MSIIPTGKKRRIKRKFCAENPTIWIGKSGASQQLVKEIEKQLDKDETVKIRILQSALATSDAKTLASQIAEQIEASLVEVRGHTFVLYRRRKR